MCKMYRRYLLLITFLILIISGCGHTVSNSEEAISVAFSTENSDPDVKYLNYLQECIADVIVQTTDCSSAYSDIEMAEDGTIAKVEIHSGEYTFSDTEKDSIVQYIEKLDGNQNVEVIFSNESQEFSEVRFIEEKNDEEESFYRVETDLLATDFSVISESLSDMIKQEWNRWDNMTSEQRMLSSSIPGMIFFDCETWTECEETIGLTIYNPLEGFDWLEKVGYFGMEVPDISHVQAMANASSQINGRELNEITITSGYNSEGIRITLMAVVSSRDDIYTIGSRYSGMATYDHKTVFTGSGIPVLVVITDGQNNLGYYNGDYYDPTAYWVRDNVFYTLRVTGERSEEKEIQELFDRIISEI